MTELKFAPKPKVMLEENREAFNQAVAAGRVPDLSSQNLSDLDLTGFDLHNANLAGAYLRGVNLGGADLSGANLHGASLKSAKVSGCLFPPEISAEEIRLSLDKGTRIRHIKKRA